MKVYVQRGITALIVTAVSAVLHAADESSLPDSVIDVIGIPFVKQSEALPPLGDGSDAPGIDRGTLIPVSEVFVQALPDGRMVMGCRQTQRPTMQGVVIDRRTRAETVR